MQVNINVNLYNRIKVLQRFTNFVNEENEVEYDSWIFTLKLLKFKKWKVSYSKFASFGNRFSIVQKNVYAYSEKIQTFL